MSELQFQDPYADFVTAQLLTPTEKLKLKREELEVLMASIRSEIITDKTIRKILREKALKVIAELMSARKYLQQQG